MAKPFYEQKPKSLRVYIIDKINSNYGKFKQNNKTYYFTNETIYEKMIHRMS